MMYNIFMPLIFGRDKKGNYVKYGKHGAKYYFYDIPSKNRAIRRAGLQARAIHAAKAQTSKIQKT